MHNIIIGVFPPPTCCYPENLIQILRCLYNILCSSSGKFKKKRLWGWEGGGGGGGGGVQTTSTLHHHIKFNNLQSLQIHVPLSGQNQSHIFCLLICRKRISFTKSTKSYHVQTSLSLTTDGMHQHQNQTQWNWSVPLVKDT